MLIQKRNLKVAFLNPPHADWSLANNMTYLMCQSHYTHNGKYAEQVQWIPAPYKWNSYQSYDDVYEEIKEADIVLFSSYVWNYTIVDEFCQYIKKKNPNVITVVGGPHIGTNEVLLMMERYALYDFICQPTKPGETFVSDLIDSWFEDGYPNLEKISWAVGSTCKRSYELDKENYSVYEDNLAYLSEICSYAKSNNMEPFIVIETTRGCPYKCVFCEWGGGINTKIIKKDIEIVKRDILALKRAGFRDAYLTDANFGAFEDRDIEIFAFAWGNNFNLTDISTMKSKSLDRRKRLIDKWFNVVGSTIDQPKTLEKKSGLDMWGATESVSIVPTVSIQSISEDAMRIADRVDLSTQDKLELSRYINKRCSENNFPIPALELILAMPGSTIQDFYDEMEVIWNFKAWGSFRHDYMFLPDSTLNSDDYKKKYDIKTVEVYSDIVDEDGIDNWNSLYKNKKTHFRTIKSCFSFTEEEMKEMWLMNNAANYLLKNVYADYEAYMTPGEFVKECYNVISQLDDFVPIMQEIDDIFDPKTTPKSIRQLCGQFRVDTIDAMLNKNLLLIKNKVMVQCLI
jgi:hypothetical protein